MNECTYVMRVGLLFVCAHSPYLLGRIHLCGASQFADASSPASSPAVLRPVLFFHYHAAAGGRRVQPALRTAATADLACDGAAREALAQRGVGAAHQTHAAH